MSCHLNVYRSHQSHLSSSGPTEINKEIGGGLTGGNPFSWFCPPRDRQPTRSHFPSVLLHTALFSSPPCPQLAVSLFTAIFPVVLQWGGGQGWGGTQMSSAQFGRHDRCVSFPISLYYPNLSLKTPRPSRPPGCPLPWTVGGLTFLHWWH